MIIIYTGILEEGELCVHMQYTMELYKSIIQLL